MVACRGARAVTAAAAALLASLVLCSAAQPQREQEVDRLLSKVSPGSHDADSRYGADGLKVRNLDARRSDSGSPYLLARHYDSPFASRLVRPAFRQLFTPPRTNYDNTDRTPTFGNMKRNNFDEIDRTGHSDFSRRNFDEIDRTGPSHQFRQLTTRPRTNYDNTDRTPTFGNMKGNNFDEIDRTGHSDFSRRNFDEIDRTGPSHQFRQLFTPPRTNYDNTDRTPTFGNMKRNNFDEIDRTGHSDFSRRNFDEIDRTGPSHQFRQLTTRPRTNYDNTDRTPTFGNMKGNNFDEIDRTGHSDFSRRNFDEIDRTGPSHQFRQLFTPPRTNYDNTDRTPTFGNMKRNNFDEIDRTGHSDFSRRNFDEIDRTGPSHQFRQLTTRPRTNYDNTDRTPTFGNMKGNNFDEIDRTGHSDFSRRNFDEIDRTGPSHQFRQLFTPPRTNYDNTDRTPTFGNMKRNNFDEIDRTGHSDFSRRNFDEIDRTGPSHQFRQLTTRPRTNYDNTDRTPTFGNMKGNNFDEIDRTGNSDFSRRNFDEIDRMGPSHQFRQLTTRPRTNYDNTDRTPTFGNMKGNNFDEIDRTGNSDFSRRNFDEIDRTGPSHQFRQLTTRPRTNYDNTDRTPTFGNMKGNNFDEIDRTGNSDFSRRNFDEIDRTGPSHQFRQLTTRPRTNDDNTDRTPTFGNMKGNNFDEIDRTGHSDFSRRNFDEIDRTGPSHQFRQLRTRPRTNDDNTDRTPTFGNMKGNNFDEIDRTGHSDFSRRNFDEIDRTGLDS